MLPLYIQSNLDVVPIERAETIPSRWYTEPEMLDIEKEKVFGSYWQLVGHCSQVQNAGDYFPAEVAGNPIIVVKGKDNQIRAFYNVCRHRGGPIAIEKGNAVMLQCKYHGWTYTLEGMLRGTPRFDRTELFDKKDYGLIPIAIEEWEGLLFVNLSKSLSSLSLAETVEGISNRILSSLLTKKKYYKRVNYEVRCNWKVYVDNYLEGYHLPFVHPELCTLLDYQEYITETHRYYSLQYSPLKEEKNFYKQQGASAEQALYYFIFPNMMLNILPGRLQTNIVLPLTNDRTLVIFDYFYDDISSPDALRMISEDIAYSDKIQQEDIEICERVQRGLQSQAYDKGRFSVEMEQAVYHFQTMLKQALQADNRV